LSNVALLNESITFTIPQCNGSAVTGSVVYTQSLDPLDVAGTTAESVVFPVTTATGIFASYSGGQIIVVYNKDGTRNAYLFS
jgi:hypothetical protein